MRRAFHPVLPTWRQEEIPGFKNDQSTTGTSPAVQWFKLCASTAWGTGSIPGELRSSIPTHMVKEKKKRDDQSYYFLVEYGLQRQRLRFVSNSVIMEMSVNHP